MSSGLFSYSCAQQTALDDFIIPRRSLLSHTAPFAKSARCCCCCCCSLLSSSLNNEIIIIMYVRLLVLEIDPSGPQNLECRPASPGRFAGSGHVALANHHLGAMELPGEGLFQPCPPPPAFLHYYYTNPGTTPLYLFSLLTASPATRDLYRANLHRLGSRADDRATTSMMSHFRALMTSTFQSALAPARRPGVVGTGTTVSDPGRLRCPGR